MDLKVLKNVMDLLEKSSLEVLEIKYKDIEIKLKKPSTTINSIQQQVQPLMVNNGEKKVIDNKNYFKSPIVGTCYLKPNPNAKEYVSVGKQVKKGEILCIIEAMKVMNEIKSDRDGVIKEILVTNSELVEFNQNLFVIE